MRTYILTISGSNSIAQVTARTVEDAKAIASEHTGIPARRFRNVQAAE